MCFRHEAHLFAVFSNDRGIVLSFVSPEAAFNLAENGNEPSTEDLYSKKYAKLA
jgi:hypothetical protein